jgi:hypothetical protein
MQGFNVGVVTLKGDVCLIRNPDNQSRVDEAIKVARAADGAHSIHDELSIGKQWIDVNAMAVRAAQPHVKRPAAKACRFTDAACFALEKA